eukprot:m.83294 g.83294  ORF g.83294 m.83294 type:complete len:186 (-) comp9527_c0_seq3:93-650(-)
MPRHTGTTDGGTAEPQYLAGLMVPSLLQEAKGTTKAQGSRPDQVRRTAAFDPNAARSPTSLVTSSMNADEQIKEVNPFEGKAKPQYLDQVHKTQMYYNVAETRNMTARTVQTTTSVTAHAKATPRSMPDNDFKHLIGGQYQTDWVADQKKMKAKARANKKKNGRTGQGNTNPGMGLFRNNNEESR